jgi:putative transposase
MSIRKVNFVQGEYYHVYNRGNSKQKIFLDRQDYLHFICLLYACNNKKNLRIWNLIGKKQTPYNLEQNNPLVSIGSYCLMPNHFHVLITERIENGISKFMQKLSTAYVMYFNQKYERTGGLFEGKFKSQHLNTDKYLKYIFSYIHLNPIKLIDKEWKEKGIKNKKIVLEHLDNYFYSSYLDFLEQRRIQNKILNLKAFPSYFPNKDSFKKEIFEWLQFESESEIQ